MCGGVPWSRVALRRQPWGTAGLERDAGARRASSVQVCPSDEWLCTRRTGPVDVLLQLFHGDAPESHRCVRGAREACVLDRMADRRPVEDRQGHGPQHARTSYDRGQVVRLQEEGVGAGRTTNQRRAGRRPKETISSARVFAVGPTTTWTTRPERTTPNAPAARNASSSTFAWSVTSTRRRVIQGSRAVMFSRPPRPATMSDAVLMATPFSVPVLSQSPSVMRSVGRLKSFVVTITLSHLHAVRGEGARSVRRGTDGAARSPGALRTRRHSHRAPPRFTRFPHVTLWERDRSLDDAAEEIVIPLAETSHSGRSQGTMSDDPFRLR